MLTFGQNILILGLTMFGSLLFMVWLNRTWPVGNRHTQNDLVGWQLSVLGTTYAVTLGFMLYTDWTNFNNAYLNAELEANACAIFIGLRKACRNNVTRSRARPCRTRMPW